MLSLIMRKYLQVFACKCLRFYTSQPILGMSDESTSFLPERYQVKISKKNKELILTLEAIIDRSDDQVITQLAKEALSKLRGAK